MGYTDASLVSAFLKRDLTNTERLTLSVMIPAIEKYIDNKCGMTFAQVDETTRIYDGGSGSLDIDPATGITLITSLNDDGTDSYDYVVDTDYTTAPHNENVKTEIRRRSGFWPSGANRIAVTAKFSGWDDGVPQDIQVAATMIAADMMRVGASNEGIKSESLEGHSVTYQDNNAQKIGDSNVYVKSILELHTQRVVG